MNILFVEPSKAYSQIISSLLNKKDDIASVFHSGDEALNSLAVTSPDAICVAHELGDMNSFEFIAKLKQNGICSDIPKFLISSYNSDEFRKRSYDIGYTEVFEKSEVSILRRALRSMMIYTTSHIKARILYVEDVPSTAAYTKSIMSNVGWDVLHVSTGEEAIEILETRDFDLIITDLILPGKISGMNLINFIREKDHARSSPLPIMAISGWNDLLRQVFVLQQGASDFISKPFQEADFLARSLILIQNKKLLESNHTEKQRLNDMAHTDKLTGLCNRHGLDEFGGQLLTQTLSKQQPLSIMMLDLDHFKQVNDSYGHKKGDDVLHQLGRLIKQNCRENDMAVRLGGEEFICLFPNCSKENIIAKAECLRSHIKSYNPADIPITVSIGVTSVELDETSNLDVLLQTADTALYQAKENGRNRVRFIAVPR